MDKPKIVVILGPTASGKSDLAVKIAKKFSGEIISADSRQVYKGLNIGTGKITKKEMKGVPHHLLDVANPKKVFTVSDFVHLTNRTIGLLVKLKKLPIICGGTGFYIDALLGDKQIPEVPPNLNLRKELEQKTTEELFRILKELDPVRAGSIDAKNPRRLVRAIEICKALGKVPPLEKLNSQLKYSAGIRNKFEILKIGIKVEDEELKTRINKRIEEWFKQGLIKEVEGLHKKGLSWKRMSEIGLEYKLVADFLKSPVSKSDFDTSQLKEVMAERTWQYAKRQMTWFKKDKNIIWLKPKITEIQKLINEFYRT